MWDWGKESHAGSDWIGAPFTKIDMAKRIK